MAIGTSGDFVIYEDQFFAGVTEVLEQNTDAFNAASGGAIQLITQAKLGDYEQQAFVSSISGLVARRVTTSVSAATDLAMAMAEIVGGLKLPWPTKSSTGASAR